MILRKIKSSWFSVPKTSTMPRTVTVMEVEDTENVLVLIELSSEVKHILTVMHHICSELAE